jgi:hypothetical protein
MAMRTKLLTALIGVTLCLAFASNPNPVLAEKESADLRPGVSLCQRIDTNGDGTIANYIRPHFKKRQSAIGAAVSICDN